MENVSRFRAMGSICRQRAVFDPQHSWKHLGDAERWEHLAAVESSEDFNACNTGEPAKPGATPTATDSHGGPTPPREASSRERLQPLGGLSGCTISLNAAAPRSARNALSAPDSARH